MMRRWRIFAPALTTARITGAAIIALGFGLLFWALYTTVPGHDFHYVYWPATRLWVLEGVQPYSDAVPSFYNPIWTIFFLLPFGLLPEAAGRAALACFSIAVLAAAAIVFTPPGHRRIAALLLVLCSLHAQYLVVSGQIDAFPLLGVVLGWLAVRDKAGKDDGRTFAPQLLIMSLALVLVSLKPQAFIGVLLVFLLYFLQMGWRERAIVASLPVLAVAASFVAFGLTWPARWWAAYQAAPPYAATIVTTWRAAEQLGLPVVVPIAAAILVVAGTIAAWRRHGLTSDTLNFALLAGALVTTYSSPSSNPVLAAVALSRLAAASIWLAAGVYLLSLTPLLRLAYSFDVSWVDMVFTWGLWLAAWYVLRTERRSVTKAPESPTHAAVSG